MTNSQRGIPFAVESMLVYDDAHGSWSDLTSQLLVRGCQLHVFRHDIEELQQDIPCSRIGYLLQNQTTPEAEFIKSIIRDDTEAVIGTVKRVYDKYIAFHHSSSKHKAVVIAAYHALGGARKYLVFDDFVNNFSIPPEKLDRNTMYELFSNADKNKDSYVSVAEFQEWCELYPNITKSIASVPGYDRPSSKRTAMVEKEIRCARIKLIINELQPHGPNQPLPSKQIKSLFTAMDNSNKGSVSLSTFRKFFQRRNIPLDPNTFQDLFLSGLERGEQRMNIQAWERFCTKYPGTVSESDKQNTDMDKISEEVRTQRAKLQLTELE